MIVFTSSHFVESSGAFIVSTTSSYWKCGGSLTFAVMMIAQRVIEQSLSFRRLIEIVGGTTCRLTCPFIL